MRGLRAVQAVVVLCLLFWSVAHLEGSTAHAAVQGSRCAPAWTRVPSPKIGQVGDFLGGVDALAEGDAWAVGTASTGDNTSSTITEHWDGRRWSHVVSPNGGPYFNAYSDVAMISPTDVWAVGFYLPDIFSPWENHTLIAHWDGQYWVKVPSPNVPMAGNQLQSVTALSSDDVWAVGEYWRLSDLVMHTLVLHWDGIKWSNVRTDSPPEGDYFTAIASVGSAMWAVGWTGNQEATLVERWNGSEWTTVPAPSPGDGNNVLVGVTVRDQTDAWAVGSYDFVNTLAIHWDGTAWETVPSPSPGTGISGNLLVSATSPSAGDVWAAGYDYDDANVRHPLIEHWDGAEWSVVSSPAVGRLGSELADVDASSSGEVWAVGDVEINGGGLNRIALIERLCPVQVLDSGFSPKSGHVYQGATVAWAIPPSDAQSHWVTDASGMGLFDSGLRAPGTSFSFDFETAGTYPILDTVTANRYSLAVPTRVLPLVGDPSTIFTIRWSPSEPPAGYVVDVQLLRPGESSFSDWVMDQQGRDAKFIPDVGPGAYAFRARLRNAVNGGASGYSLPASILVQESDGSRA